MKIDSDKFPALFDNDIVTSRYKHILDTITYSKIRDVIDVANTVRTYIAMSIIDPMLSSYQKLISHRKELHDSCRALIYNSKAGNPHVLHYALLVE